MKLVSFAILLTMVGTSFESFGQGKNMPAQCQAPFAACVTEHYKVGAHHKGDPEGADKGLWRDCVDAVADGKKTVPGVDQGAAQACKAARRAAKGK